MSKEKIQSPEEKVVDISKDFKKLSVKSEKATITKEEHYTEANAFLVEVKARINRVKALKLEYVKPLKDNIKKLESLFNDPIKNYEGIESHIKRLMSDFRMEEERKARAEEAKLRAKREKEIKKAEDKGKPAPVTPVPIVERKEATVKTDEGKSTAKKIIKFQIEDAEKLPKKYRDQIFAKAVEKGIADQIMRPQMKLGLEISRDEKSGDVVTKLKGVKVWEDFDISVTA